MAHISKATHFDSEDKEILVALGEHFFATSDAMDFAKKYDLDHLKCEELFHFFRTEFK